MATTIRIDEINTPETFDAEQFIKDYFKPMRISKERKEEREEAAKDFRDFLLFILALIALENEYNSLNWSYIEEQFRIEFERAAMEYARKTQALEDYIAEKASDFVRITQDNDLSDPYWTSDERATYEAVNEANTVITMEEWQRAIDEGAVSKRWKTQNDSRVRDSHRAVEGHTEAINDFFHLQHGIVRFPCDFYYSPKEASGCRCGLDFLDKDGKIVAVWRKEKGLSIPKNDDIIQSLDTPKRSYGLSDKPKEMASARFATGNMDADELARAKELWYIVEEIDLPQAEREMVYEEFDNNLTDEERRSAIVHRPIGDYWYKAVNRGHNQYKIFGKEPIDPYDDWLDEILSEVVGRDWKQYDF